MGINQPDVQIGRGLTGQKHLFSLSWSVVTGLVILTLTLLLLPFVHQNWRATGDEPHYLLAAHSLTVDHDVDLANNYAELDYVNFYLSKDIVPQIRRTEAGAQLLSHYPALPFIIAPAYAWGGRLGVLFFQVVLGGILAVVTYQLAYFISRSVTAALLATVALMLTPPLLLYHYLIYPELIAALLTTTILYCILVYDKPSSSVAALVLIALILLPWLNRRFVPLAFLMALLTLWSWRNRPDGQQPDDKSTMLPGLVRPIGLAAMLVTLISVGLLVWFNSQFLAPERIDITAPTSVAGLGLRLIRGVGWLVDQQRGLFIFAPVTLLAFWGAPLLLRQSWQTHSRHWLVLVPFLFSLAGVTVAGGFWIAWEAGPRFLVVGLPGLAPVLALAWCRYRRSKVWLTFAGLLLALSLLNSAIILRQPDLPYKSSLPLYYGDALSLPVVDMLPDMAGYARLTPANVTTSQAQLVSDFDLQTGALQPEPRLMWFAPAGQPLAIIQTELLPELPFGHYILTWSLRDSAAETSAKDLLQLSIKYLGGGQLLRHTVTAGNEPRQTVRLSFFNTNIDRWRTPMVLNATTTGQSDLWAGELLLSPDPFYALFLPWFSLLLIAVPPLLIAIRNAKRHQDKDVAVQSPAAPRLTSAPWPRFFALACLSFLLVFALGNLWFYINRTTVTYNAVELMHFVGRVISDPAANDGQAWLVDPAFDPPQKAIYGPFDFYDAGQYHVVFRLKLPNPDMPLTGQMASLDADVMAAAAAPGDSPQISPEQEIARLQVRATMNYDQLLTQPIQANHFTQSNLYHDMVLTITNPRRQALSFEVEYLGLSPLVLDQVTISKLNSN